MPRIWIDTVLNVAVATSATVLTSLMTGVSATQTRFDQMTLLRTIVGIDIARTVHDSGEGSETFSIGIGIASQEAFAAASLSDPQIATDFPTRGWIWRAQYRIFGFAADQPTIFTRRVDLDLRAMRKLENGEAFVTMVNLAQEGVSSADTVTGIIRQLWLVG
jgi:hypothetical protein